MNYFNLITLRKAMKPLQVFVVAMAMFMAGSVQAGGGADMHTLESLVETIKEQQRQLEALQKQVEHLKEVATAADSHAKHAVAEASKKHGVVVYGSLRPSLTYSDFDTDTTYDVTDFLSRVGIKGHVDISEGLTAIYQGEWDVDIEANGDFGDARQAYVGLRTGLGQIAIGKQWDPHFNIVAEVTDIFNHRSSPFGYDEISPFRTNQLVTYMAHMGGLSLQAGARFDGTPDNSAGGAEDGSSEPDDMDAGSVGIGYSMGPLYAGVSYLEEHGAEDFERSFTGLGASMNVSENLYLAVTYQDIEVDHNPVDNMDYDQSSIDLAAAMGLGGGYKLKASYFDRDGDDQMLLNDNGDPYPRRSFDGYNLTLENQLNKNLRVHLEWLQRDIEHGEEEDHISVGFRYDFEAEL
ncbi:MAG: porin [Proteobacteria bacterium]|nr:porin [Pseudomonadota bacterium]